MEWGGGVVSVPSRGLYISNEVYARADGITEFPSPLGDYISLMRKRSGAGKTFTGFRPLSGTIYL